MRVLITNGSLGPIGGTQSYVFDLACWLVEQGHSPVVYGPYLGDTATQLERRTIAVTDDLSKVSVEPDIVHGNSAVETMVALLRFPRAPAIFVCHGSRGALAAPPRFPRILRYVAVDDACADRLVLREGVAPERMVVILNAVNLERFPRRRTLPSRPRRALVFSNTAHELTYVGVIREACRRAGIELDVVGLFAGTPVSEPEAILGRYDLVFAKAKCALEAMACGNAVILCDAAGLGGMVRSADVGRLRRWNFGARCLTGPLCADDIEREIAAYDAKDAAEVTELIRRTAASDELHQQLFELYSAVLEEWRGRAERPGWREAESLAAGDFLRSVAVDPYANWHAAKLTPVIQATHGVLSVPFIGPTLVRAARWLVRKRQKDRSHRN